MRFPIKGLKFGLMLPPELKDDGDFAGNTYIDTSEFSHLRVLLITGEPFDAAVGSTAEGTAVKLEECDTTDGSYTDITSAALADAIALTEDDSIFAIDVDLTKTHKRYVQVNAPHSGDGTTGCNMCILGILSAAAHHGLTAADSGLTELIEA